MAPPCGRSALHSPFFSLDCLSVLSSPDCLCVHSSRRVQLRLSPIGPSCQSAAVGTERRNGSIRANATPLQRNDMAMPCHARGLARSNGWQRTSVVLVASPGLINSLINTTGRRRPDEWMGAGESNDHHQEAIVQCCYRLRCKRGVCSSRSSAHVRSTSTATRIRRLAAV